MEDRKMELWDLYDENRNLVGLDHVRGERIPQGCYHLVVHVWIRNSAGQYLMSQRSADRPSYPLMWECVGGSVTKGEDSLTGALRETVEEVGVTLLPENGKVIHSEVREIFRGKRFADIMDVWLFRYDGPITLEKATTPEVAQAEWMTKEQIKALHNEGKLVHTLDYIFTMEGL
jgi:8-oxo-dGTP pyrophosphatase MutT (NUDIX family)